MNFWGYGRPDGQVGVRNHLAVIPSVFCASGVARRIAAQVEGAVALDHVLGCSQVGFDLEITTGRGTPTGHPIAPVIKVTGNSNSYHRLLDNIDVNAGAVVDGTRTLREMGEEIFHELLAVASGKRTKAEVLGHDELMNVWRPSSEHGYAYGCGEWA